jgi:hypothetical protein
MYEYRPTLVPIGDLRCSPYGFRLQALRIQPHFILQFPVPGWPGPTLWMQTLGGSIDLLALAQNAGRLDDVTLGRRHEFQADVLVHQVVPAYKFQHPGLYLRQIFKQLHFLARARDLAFF